MSNLLQQALDDVLVIRARDGDVDAAERLVDRYHAPLKYFLIRMLGRRDAIDDVLQEVWLAVFRQLHKLRVSEAFSIWLFRIARNRAYDLIRNSRPLQELPEDIVVIESDFDEPFSREDAAAVNECLKLLNPLHREVLLLRFLEDMSYEQIATVTGCALGTVKSRIHHAKLLLRQKMENTRAKR